MHKTKSIYKSASSEVKRSLVYLPNEREEFTEIYNYNTTEPEELMHLICDIRYKFFRSTLQIKSKVLDLMMIFNLLSLQVLTLFPIAVIFLALATDNSSAQQPITEQIGDFAKKILPEWMTNNIANLMSPTQPPEKRILFKLNGPGFHIRKVPTRGLVSRPSKVYIKYAVPQNGYYKMYRPPLNYINHPYQFEKIAYKPQMEYVFEKPSIPIAYQQPAPYPYYPPPPQETPTYESGPIHTIPAPNLGGLAPQGTNTHEQIYENQPIYYPQVQLQVQQQQVHQHQQQQPEAQVRRGCVGLSRVFSLILYTPL